MQRFSSYTVVAEWPSGNTSRGAGILWDDSAIFAARQWAQDGAVSVKVYGNWADMRPEPAPVIFETGADAVDQKRKAEDFEILDHGLEHSQYFQGCGIADPGSEHWEDCATGIGDNPREALDDALEQLAQSGGLETEWDTEDLETRIRKTLPESRRVNAETPSALESIREDLETRYIVRFAPHCGMSGHSETFESLDDAREHCAEILRDRWRTGHPVVRIAEDGRENLAWETGEPKGCAMVPDTAGILSLEDDSETLDSIDPPEIHYFISIRVR